MTSLATPQQRFSALICRLVAAVWGLGATYPGGVLNHATAVMIIGRLQPIAHRLRALADRMALGLLRPRRARRPAIPPAAPSAQPGAPPSPRPPALRWPHRLRGSHAWLIGIARHTAPLGSQLDALLRDPEMQALIAAAPQLRRILRPLCRMLGVTTLKEIPPPPDPPPDPSPDPSPVPPADPAEARPDPPRPARPASASPGLPSRPPWHRPAFA